MVSSNQMVTLCPGDAIISTAKYLTPCFEKEAKFTENNVPEDACKDVWNDMFPIGIEQESGMDAMSSETDI